VVPRFLLDRCSSLNIVVADRNHYREEKLVGRFAYSMNVSLDLRIEQVPGDNGAGEWLRIDEEFHHEANARTDGTIAVGGATLESEAG